MDEEYLMSFVYFVASGYQRQKATARLIARIRQRVRDQNPGLVIDPGYAYWLELYPRILSRYFRISEQQAAYAIASYIRKPFRRAWNRSVNPGAMLALYTRRREVPTDLQDFLGEEIDQAQNDAENEEDQDRIDAIELANYNLGIGNWGEGVNDLSLIVAGITDEDYIGGRLRQQARERLYEVRKNWADEIRQSVEIPEPMEAIVI